MYNNYNPLFEVIFTKKMCPFKLLVTLYVTSGLLEVEYFSLSPLTKNGFLIITEKKHTGILLNATVFNILQIIVF